MYHDVLNVGKIILDRVVNILGNLVSLPDRKLAVNADFDIHVDFTAENSRPQQIDVRHTLNFFRSKSYVFLCFCFLFLLLLYYSVSPFSFSDFDSL